VINQEMRKLIKSILLEVGVEDLKIRPRGDNRCESAKRLPRDSLGLPCTCLTYSLFQVYNPNGMNAPLKRNLFRSHFKVSPALRARAFSSASMAKAVTQDSRYRMLCGYEIPILGFGVRKTI